MASVSDNFNRADENPLGAPWVSPNSQPCKIVSNKAQGTGAGVANTAEYDGSGLGNDQWAQGTVTISNTGLVWVMVRRSGTGWTGYTFHGSATVSKLRYYANSTPTTLADNGPGLVTGDVIYVEVVGTSITGKVNGSVVLGPVTHATLTAGDPGFVCYGDPGLIDAQIDDWSASDVFGGGVPDRATSRGLARGIARGLANARTMVRDVSGLFVPKDRRLVIPVGAY